MFFNSSDYQNESNDELLKKRKMSLFQVKVEEVVPHKQVKLEEIYDHNLQNQNQPKTQHEPCLQNQELPKLPLCQSHQIERLQAKTEEISQNQPQIAQSQVHNYLPFKLKYENSEADSISHCSHHSTQHSISHHHHQRTQESCELWNKDEKSKIKNLNWLHSVQKVKLEEQLSLDINFMGYSNNINIQNTNKNFNQQQMEKQNQCISLQRQLLDNNNYQIISEFNLSKRKVQRAEYKLIQLNSHLAEDNQQQYNNIKKDLEQEQQYNQKPIQITQIQQQLQNNNNTHIIESKIKNCKFICPICTKYYCNKQYLKKHIETQHDIKEQTCQFCNKLLKLDCNSFSNHLEKCRNDRICIYCEQGRMNSKQLEEHIIENHQDKILLKESNLFLECDICHKQNFRTQAILQQHIKKAHTSVSLKCQYCEQAGFCQTTLLRHYRQAHINNQICGFCGEFDLTMEELERHQKMHKKLSSFADQQEKSNINNQNIQIQNKNNRIFDKTSNKIEKMFIPNVGIAEKIQEDLDEKQIQLKNKINQINQTQKSRYAKKKSSYTSKIQRILSLV